MHEPLPSRRTAASFAVACGIHVVLVALTWKHAPASPPPATKAPEGVEEWEIEAPAEIESPASPNDEPARPLEPARPSAAAPSVQPSTDTGTPSPSPPSASAAPAGVPWSFSPTGPKPLDIGLGSARAPAAFAPRPGTLEVDVLIRPEAVQVTPAPEGQAEVIAASFRGASVRLRVALSGVRSWPTYPVTRRYDSRPAPG